MTNWKMTALTILLAGATAANLAGQPLELVSRIHPSHIADTGAAANRSTQSPDAPHLPLTVSISDNGRYVAFVSTATNLVAGQQDTNSGNDVFLRDLLTGVTTLVSRSMASPVRTGSLGSHLAAISGDGRYVAFVSRAKNLAPGQTGDFFGLDTDLLFYDWAAGTITLVAQTTGPSVSVEDLAINTDGRYLAFTSSAGNLVPGDDSSSRDVFLYDRVAGTIRLVSQPAAVGSSWKPVISPDGRFVVFQNLDDGSGSLFDRTSGALTPLGSLEGAAFSANGRYLAFTARGSLSLYDLQTRTTISPLGEGHTQITNNRIAISDDGRFTVFSSSDASLPGQNPLFRTLGLYLFDRTTGTFTLVSLESRIAPEVGSHPSISGDGRFIVFVNSRPDVVPGQADEEDFHDVFLFDRTIGKTAPLSAAGTSSTTTGNGASYRPLISRNGARVVFESLASDLVPELKDLNRGEDVYAYETASGIRSAVTLRAPEAPSLTSDGSFAQAGALSADGRFVAFDSDSPHLLPSLEDGNGGSDVFLYDAVTKSTLLVSRSQGSASRTANGASSRPAISADGRYVLYVSGATDLVTGTPDPRESLSFSLFDRVAGTNRFVGSAVAQVFNQLPEMTISADGRWVAYISDLIPGQPQRGGVPSVLLWDRETGSTTLVSHSRSAATERANGESFAPALSSDGRYVAFVSEASDLDSAGTDTDHLLDLFLFDRITGETALVSRSQVPTAPASPVRSNRFSMSADGRFIVFIAWTEVSSRPPGLYLYDRLSGTSELLAYPAYVARISADGRYVAFTGYHPTPENPGSLQVPPGLYLYDRISKTTLPVPPLANPGDFVQIAGEPALSANGRYVAFARRAFAPVPVPFSTPGLSGDDIILFDRVSRSTVLVSRSPFSPVTPMGESEKPLISADGQRIAFTSTAGLKAEDFNDLPDAYLFTVAGPAGGGTVPLPPCKLLDTRRRADRPALRSDTRRTVRAAGVCGVPATAKSVSVTVTALQATGKGNLRFYAGNDTANPSGILRFEKNATRSATFTVPLATNGAGTLAVLPFVAGKGTVQVVVEVNGYSQ